MTQVLTTADFDDDVRGAHAAKKIVVQNGSDVWGPTDGSAYWKGPRSAASSMAMLEEYNTRSLSPLRRAILELLSAQRGRSLRCLELGPGVGLSACQQHQLGHQVDIVSLTPVARHIWPSEYVEEARGSLAEILNAQAVGGKVYFEKRDASYVGTQFVGYYPHGVQMESQNSAYDCIGERSGPFLYMDDGDRESALRLTTTLLDPAGMICISQVSNQFLKDWLQRNDDWMGVNTESDLVLMGPQQELQRNFSTARDRLVDRTDLLETLQYERSRMRSRLAQP